MIPRTESRWQTSDWQMAMKNMIRSVEALATAVEVEISAPAGTAQAAQDFALRVPESFVRRMHKGNPQDPLLLQVLPQAGEMVNAADFTTDPLSEAEFNPVPGLIHKYHGRVLLITTPSCTIHCRYCFRRHFPYTENTPGTQHWDQALDYIRAHKNVHEVILSGGDPLSANDDYLQQLIQAIAEIAHVKTLRLHSRLPIVLPQRITNTLLTILTGTRLKCVMVIHSNHANELQDDCVEALELLQAHGIRLLNQAVLLKGVNATVEAQKALLERLYELNIQAYYLHLLDKVKGAEHFYCADEVGQQIYAKLMALLPGYMLPRLVREFPQATSKTSLNVVNLPAATINQ